VGFPGRTGASWLAGHIVSRPVSKYGSGLSVKRDVLLRLPVNALGRNKGAPSDKPFFAKTPAMSPFCGPTCMKTRFGG